MTENRRRWLGISLVAGAAVLAIALITWLLTGGGSTSTAATAPPTPTPSASPSATSTPKPTPKAGRSSHGGGRVGAGQGTFIPGWGWAQSVAKHTLLIQMVSTRPVYVKMGWKVPQSTPKGGAVQGHLGTWSRSFTVYGPPKYAAFYIYYGGTVTTVSCRIYLDGTVRIEKTTSGKYGALMCVA